MTTRRTFTLLLLTVLAMLACVPLARAAEPEATERMAVPQPVNLLRNGSFEGGLLYWHNTNENKRLVEEGKVGRYALRIDGDWVASAPWPAKRDGTYTVSFWAKAVEGEANVGVAMAPSAREEAVNAGRLWSKKAGQSAKLTEEWQRISFTWPTDVPTTGFWPQPHYMVHFGGKGILIDGVTVVEGDKGTADYLPRRAVEVVAECQNLPGYAGAKGNIFEQDAEAQVAAHVSNPGPRKRDITIRWQLMDYEGVDPVAGDASGGDAGKAIDEKLTLDPGQTISLIKPLKLTARGLVLARVSVLDGNGEVIDSSDFPLTTLPYPANATKPDMRQRFGGSFAGGTGVLDKFQRLGFGWTRWYPGQKWHDFEPEEGKYNWQDDKFQIAFDRGVACHITLYGWPKWIMDKDLPLPRDMRWKADDARWSNLENLTAWDKFIVAITDHFRGKPVVFEISNEPGFDKWDNHLAEYVKFNERTAALIKKTDPKALVMLDNVYTNPSRPNSRLLKDGDLTNIDLWSWHDYHGGWLNDAQGITRIRQMLDEAGTNPGKGKHIEIWFNEGWAFTNTAVDEPIACTSLTSAQSTNAIFDSVAEMTVAGQEKTVLFHTAYESHGMSFWDYSGPGTMLWDWYNNPMPLVAAWNVLNYHIGVSDEVGLVRPPSANFAIFHDLRNDRGVVIAYADRGAKEDVTVELPDLGKGLLIEDAMGNHQPAPRKLVLSKTGRPALLYNPEARTSGKAFYEKLEGLDRKHSGFVSQGEGGVTEWRLPATWEGKEKGKPDGGVVEADGKPVWKAEQVWPADPMKAENYRPLVWGGTQWSASADGVGGQPQFQIKDDAAEFGTRAPHGTPPALRTAALSFVVPADGDYQVLGTASARMWDSKNKTDLLILRRTGQSVELVKQLEIGNGEKKGFEGVKLTAKAGDIISLVPRIQGMYAGGTLWVRDLRITGGKR